MSINLRAAASCIPFIGPAIAINNYVDLKDDQKKSLNPAVAHYEKQKKAAAADIAKYQAQANEHFELSKTHGASSDGRYSDETIRNYTNHMIERENKTLTELNDSVKDIKISFFKKGRIYAAAGLVGKVLTTAILISIIVATALSGVLVVGAAVSLSIALAVSIGFSIYSGYKLYTFNRNLKVLQAT